MEGHIPEEEKQRRLVIVQEKQRAIQIRRNAELIGGIEEVMVEGRHQALASGLAAHPPTARSLHSPGYRRRAAGGQYLPVRVTRSGPNSLVGESVGAL